MPDGVVDVRDRLCRECDMYRWPHEFGGRGRASMCLLCKESRKQQRVVERCAALFAELPKAFGKRTMLAVERWSCASNEGYCAVLECVCGRITRLPVFDWKRQRVGQACSSCAGRDRASAERQELSRCDLETPGYMAMLHGAWAHLPVDRDPHFREFERAMGGKATLQELAEFYGISRERIRQIEERALEKLKQSDDGTLRRALDGLSDHDDAPRSSWNGALSWDELPTFADEPQRVR